jgi:SAM-dependent methyltransferase
MGSQNSVKGPDRGFEAGIQIYYWGIQLELILFGNSLDKAKTFLRKTRIWANRYWKEEELPNLRRGQRERCWCGGKLNPFRWHPSYGVCVECCCYVNKRPPLGEEYQELYSWNFYWHKRQKRKGFPTIEFRAAHDRCDGRLDHWLKVVETYSVMKGKVIEAGCGHGVLLGELKKRGYDCLGVEIDEKVAAWTRRETGVDIRVGFFPAVELPQCDLFMAFDVIEHSPRPEEFMRGVALLLKPKGSAIIQTPIDHYQGQPPFPENFGNVFDDLEHLFVFTPESIRALGEYAGLSIIAEATGVRDRDIRVFRPIS